MIPLYLLLYKIYMPRVNAFGCFDDCFNIVGGYFIDKGKTLYSQVYFNHNMIAPYISSIIQHFLHPINIYELILRHRQFVLLFGLICNALLVMRFGMVGFGFFVIYEFSKFYVFGDRFLAEGLVVYPLVYLMGVFLHKMVQKKIFSWDYIISALAVWFVIFAREPFIPAAIVLYILILFGKPFSLPKKISLGLFFILVLAVFSITPIPEYIFNVIYINIHTVGLYDARQGKLFGSGLLEVFFYPIYIFITGSWNLFRQLLIGVDFVFLILLFYFIEYKKNIKLVVFLIFVLGFANIRYIPPGNIFYAAFHMIPWYGMNIFATLFLLSEMRRSWQKYALIGFLAASFTYFLLSPANIIWDKISTHEEFITNYGNYLQIGEVVKILSNPSETLFVDGFDELILWAADRPSPYLYLWYTSFMPRFPIYADTRLEMFKKNPPDFYYGSCPKEKSPERMLPKTVKSVYQNLYSGGKPTCLYIKKSKIPSISQDKWKKAKKLFYELPKQ